MLILSFELITYAKKSAKHKYRMVYIISSGLDDQNFNTIISELIQLYIFYP